MPDPPTFGGVASGVVAGLVISLVGSFVVGGMLPGGRWSLWVLLLVPPLLGLVLLLVPRWRRSGAGLVKGLGVGGIVFAGVCGSFLFSSQML